MTDKYSHRERLMKTINGEKTDRTAGSLWRHFYHREADLDNFADAMLEFQKRFDWDFMKINPRASYHVEDWGNKLKWSTDQFQKHQKTHFVVDTVNDWDKIEPLKMTAPVLSGHLTAIDKIKKLSDPELPLFMTLFCPLGIARYLCGSKEKLLEHLSQDESKVISALENITITYENYAREIRNAGCDGLFYATLEWASSDMLTIEQYNRFGRPYDLRIIRSAGDDAINILHVCASNNYLKELSDYPVQLINWDSSDPTNLHLDDYFKLQNDKTVIGGLDDKGWLWHSKPKEIESEVSRIKESMSGRRFIFGPGCAIDPEIPYENLDALKRSL